MNISNIQVRVNKFRYQRVKAYISLVLDDCFAIHDIMVMEGDRGLYLSMPHRHCSDGTYKDIFHPIDRKTRQELSAACIFAYEQEKKKITF